MKNYNILIQAIKNSQLPKKIEVLKKLRWKKKSREKEKRNNNRKKIGKILIIKIEFL